MEEEEEMFRFSKAKGLGDFHLRSAMSYPDIETLERGGGRHREKLSFRKIKGKYKSNVINVGEPAVLLQYILDQEDENKLIELDILEDVHDILSLEEPIINFGNEGKGLLDRLLPLLKQGYQSSLSVIRAKLQTLIMILISLTSGRTPPETEDLKIEDNLWKVFHIHDIKIEIFDEFVIFDQGHYLSKGSSLYIYNLDCIRMICDKITERENVIIACHFGNQLFPEIYPKVHIIKRVFIIFDDHLKLKGNEGYKLLKTFEALVTGVILNREGSNYRDSREFLDNTIEGLDDDIDKDTALNFIDYLMGQHMTIHHLTQIMGLFRLWGHPVIDAKKGVEKVRTIGTKKKIINERTSLISSWVFKETLFRNYFSQKGRYINFEIIPNNEQSYLINCLIENISLNTRDPLYSLDHWKYVQIMKTFDIPQTFNLSMIVADTAISPTREEMRDCYVKNEPGLDPVIRRGVLKWMKDGVLDCNTLLNTVDKHPMGLPRNHLIIGLYQKERELNPVARMFALMSLMMRAVIVVTESMIADHIIPYIPGITMTYSLLELSKEMIKSTWRQRNKSMNSVTFCINIDFEKWNLNMRQKATWYIFKNMGELFGLSNLYNKTYDMFKNSIIYLADGSYILKLDEYLNLIEEDPNKAYEGHIGGFEGLRQKGWTVFTVSLITYICEKHNIDWKLMGQGDNQVLIVTIYSKHGRKKGMNHPDAIKEVQEKLNQLINELIQIFSSVGLPLKPLETWISDIFFSYGKFPIYKGLPCSMSLKRISRIFSFSNEDLMTMDNAMGAITANAQSAAMADPFPIIPYMICKIQHILCIKLFSWYHPLLGEEPIKEGEEISFLMGKDKRSLKEYKNDWRADNSIEKLMLIIWPKVLGGLNTCNWFKMIMRGFPDMANLEMQYLDVLYDRARGLLKECIGNVRSLMLNEEINYSYLIQDPAGLNLFIPLNSTQVIKNMIHTTIEQLNFNSQFSDWFKDILKVSDTEVIRDLSNKLMMTDQVNIRFLHDILGASLFGYCDSITSKIDKTVTLSRIALGSADVVGTLMKNEKRYLNYLLWRICIKGNLDRDMYNCPTSYLIDARNLGWQKIIQGINVPFPYHFLTTDPEKTHNPQSFVQVIKDERALVSQDMTLTTIGGALPYLGSVTKEKILSTPNRIAYGTEPLVSRPVRLLRTIGWFVEPNSKFERLLKNLLLAVTDLDPNKLINIPDHIKGSMVHRYSDMALKHGSLWMPLYGPATFLNLSTNQLIEFAKGSKNVNLHFQALLCMVQSYAVSSLFCEKRNKTLECYISCPHCIKPVDDEFQDLQEDIPEELIPSRPLNPYLFIKKEEIMISTNSILESITKIRKRNIFEFTERQLYNIVTDQIAARATHSILSLTSNDDEHSTLLDISGVPRTFYLKIHPKDLYKKTITYLWIKIGANERYSKEKFPSWSSVKSSLIRTLSRLPNKNFIFLSGYFLWNEGILTMNEMKAIMPLSYPMTADSIAEASKQSLIKMIKEIKYLELSSISAICSGSENIFYLILKQVLLEKMIQKEEIKGCPKCIQQILQIQIKGHTKIQELFEMKCELGHYILQLQNLNQIFYIGNVPFESLLDRISGYSIPSKMKTLPTFMITRTKGIKSHRMITKHDLIDRIEFDWTSQDIITPVPNYEVEYFNMGYIWPTQSLYRIWEICHSPLISTRSNTIMIGDGYGFSSLCLSGLFPNIKVIGWTYLQISDGISHSILSSLPPTHYYFKNPILTSQSLLKISDIGNEGFEESFKEVVEKHDIKQLISEIEWWYVGPQHIEKLVKLCAKYKVDKICLKIDYKEMNDLKIAINVVDHHYDLWEVQNTKLVNPLGCNSWLIGSSLRKDVGKKFLGGRSWRGILTKIKSFTFGDLNKFIDEERQIHPLDLQLDRIKEITDLMSTHIDSWFNSVGLEGWKSKDFTSLLNSIRTGKRSKEVSDMGGSKIYFMREEDWTNILERLMALAGALISDDHAYRDFFMSNWKIEWKKAQYDDLNKRQPIFLQKIQGKMHNINKGNVIRMSNLIRSNRRVNKHEREMRIVEDTVEFKYEPKSQILHFPVSKISSYQVKKG